MRYFKIEKKSLSSQREPDGEIQRRRESTSKNSTTMWSSLERESWCSYQKSYHENTQWIQLYPKQNKKSSSGKNSPSQRNGIDSSFESRNSGNKAKNETDQEIRSFDISSLFLSFFTITKSLCDVLRSDIMLSCEISDSSCELECAIIRSGREIQSLNSLL